MTSLDATADAILDVVLALPGEAPSPALLNLLAQIAMPATNGHASYKYAEPEQEEPPGHEGAVFYASLLNDLEAAGQDVEDIAEQARRELEEDGWTLVRVGGKWVAEHEETGVEKYTEKAPAGGIRAMLCDLANADTEAEIRRLCQQLGATDEECAAAISEVKSQLTYRGGQ